MAFTTILKRKFMSSYLISRLVSSNLGYDSFIPSRGQPSVGERRYFSSRQKRRGTRPNSEPIDVSERGWYCGMMEQDLDLDMDLEELLSDFDSAEGLNIDTFLSKDEAEFKYRQKEGYFCSPWTIPSQGYITVTTDAATISEDVKDAERNHLQYRSVFANVFRSSEEFIGGYIGILPTDQCSEAELYGSSYAVYESMRVGNERVKIETDNEEAFKILSNAKNSRPHKNIKCGGELSFDDFLNFNFICNNVRSFKGFGVEKVPRLHVYSAHTLVAIGCKLLPKLRSELTSIARVEKLVDGSDDIEVKNLWFSFMHSVKREYCDNVFTLVCH